MSDMIEVDPHGQCVAASWPVWPQVQPVVDDGIGKALAKRIPPLPDARDRDGKNQCLKRICKQHSTVNRIATESSSVASHTRGRLDHVRRNTDGVGLVGDRVGNGLADPPADVGEMFPGLEKAAFVFPYSCCQAIT
jgi:hypothetical protein